MTDDLIKEIVSYLRKKKSTCCAKTNQLHICKKKRKISGFCTQHYEIIKQIIFKAFQEHVSSARKPLT